MKNIKFVVFLVIVLTSCGSNDSSTNKLQSQIESLRKENSNLRDTIELYKFPAIDRYISIDKLIAENEFSKAKSEIEVLKKIFPLSIEANKTAKQLKLIEEKEKKIIEEDARKKALGFKVLKEENNIQIGYNKISISNFSTAQTFTVDSYDDSYRFFTADRGNKYISTRISISSSDKDPMLPMFYAYSVNGDKLELIGNFILRFARWRDYGTYLGNNHDNANDFSKTSTVPFKIGIEVSDESLQKPIVILARNENCLIRSTNRFDNPPVSYSAGSCHSQKTLSIEDLKDDYFVVKILNKNKL